MGIASRSIGPTVLPVELRDANGVSPQSAGVREFDSYLDASGDDNQSADAGQASGAVVVNGAKRSSDLPSAGRSLPSRRARARGNREELSTALASRLQSLLDDAITLQTTGTGDMSYGERHRRKGEQDANGGEAFAPAPKAGSKAIASAVASDDAVSRSSLLTVRVESGPWRGLTIRCSQTQHDMNIELVADDPAVRALLDSQHKAFAQQIAREFDLRVTITVGQAPC